MSDSENEANKIGGAATLGPTLRPFSLGTDSLGTNR